MSPVLPALYPHVARIGFLDNQARSLYHPPTHPGQVKASLVIGFISALSPFVKTTGTSPSPYYTDPKSMSWVGTSRAACTCLVMRFAIGTHSNDISQRNPRGSLWLRITNGRSVSYEEHKNQLSRVLSLSRKWW